MNLDMKKDRNIERQFKKVLEKNELIALNTIENIGSVFLKKDGQKLETEDQLKTRYQTKMALIMVQIQIILLLKKQIQIKQTGQICKVKIFILKKGWIIHN